MAPLKDLFLLRSDITYLNFGSFGACPLPVFNAYQTYQRELEEEPVQFFLSNGPQYLRRSREALGKYLNAQADDLVYVTNPSYAVNIVAKSLRLEPGDEILTTDLEYGACDRTWNFCCKRTGAVLRRQKISLPLEDRQRVVEELFSGVTVRTKMIFVSHITSTTALILPVDQICARARSLGIPCFIDGAHAPGQVPVDLDLLAADYYTGACHKWMLAPKGAAFLHTRKDRQPDLDPLVVSWGYESAAPSDSQYLDHHEGQGTRDYSAFLTIPAALEFMKAHDWENVSRQCRSMVFKNAPVFCDLLKTQPLAPLSHEYIGQMLSLAVKCGKPETVQRKLFEKYRIEIPLMPHGDQVYLRFSINGFNEQADLDRLSKALQELITNKDLLV